VLEPIDHRRDRPGRQSTELGQPAGRDRPVHLDDVEAAEVGPVQADGVGDRLVEPVGRVLRPPHLAQQLLEHILLTS
jgi:hypothetical protein